jgi:hypothetical protein
LLPGLDMEKQVGLRHVVEVELIVLGDGMAMAIAHEGEDAQEGL